MRAQWVPGSLKDLNRRSSWPSAFTWQVLSCHKYLMKGEMKVLGDLAIRSSLIWGCREGRANAKDTTKLQHKGAWD
jgi:hypothetical protein